MRKTIILTALVLAVVAAIMATRSPYYYAFILGILAMALGFYGTQLSSADLRPKKTAQLAMLLGGLALGLSAVNWLAAPQQEEPLTKATEKIEESIPEKDEEDIDDEEFEDEELDTVENEITPSIKKIDSVPPPANIIKK